jgi:hypothetical protein
MLYGKVDEEKNRDTSDTSGGGEISSKQQWDSKNTWSVPLESRLSSTCVVHSEPSICESAEYASLSALHTPF